MSFPGGIVLRNLTAKQDPGVQSLGQEDPLEKGMLTQLQHSCLENSMERGAWRATVHGITAIFPVSPNRSPQANNPLSALGF